MTTVQWYFYVAHQQNKDDSVGFAQKHRYTVTGVFPSPALGSFVLLVLADREYFGRQWQTSSTVIKPKERQHPLSSISICVPFCLSLYVFSVLYSKCTNQIQLHPVISPAPSNLSRETKLPLMSLPNRETSNFLVFTSREMTQKIGCILSGWIITIHSDALRAANASYGPIFLGSKHIRVWTPVMTTLQPCWYPVTTSSRNQNVRLEEGGWIIDAVSFGFAHFTKQKKKKFLAFMACSKTLSLPGTAFSF